jgi:hypothetical protein
MGSCPFRCNHRGGEHRETKLVLSRHRSQSFRGYRNCHVRVRPFSITHSLSSDLHAHRSVPCSPSASLEVAEPSYITERLWRRAVIGEAANPDCPLDTGLQAGSSPSALLIPHYWVVGRLLACPSSRLLGECSVRVRLPSHARLTFPS